MKTKTKRASRFTPRRPNPSALIAAARRALVEPLEMRRLLSVSFTKAAIASGGEASPLFEVINATGTNSPLAGASPSGTTPTNLRKAYGIDQISFGGVAGNGAGQTIAIIDAYDDPDAASDLHNFDVAFGLSDPVLEKVAQDGSSNLPEVAPANSWALEESLDIEWAHVVAPAARIMLVEANSATDTDLIQHAAAWAADQPGVTTVSMSFGSGEYDGENYYDSSLVTPAGHPGVTFFAGSGDSGQPGLYPAYSPNVVAVGGTFLVDYSDGSYYSESGWTEGGGGVSAFEAQPSYQAGVVTQSTTQRTIPDISFDADPNTGVPVYDSYDFGSTSPWIQVGGTSLASPCVAAIIAIADQGRALSGLGSLDGPTQTLPDLYGSSPSLFHDIVTGNNGYAAGAGYDLVTGLGSPVANLLAPSLAGDLNDASLTFGQQPTGIVAGNTMSPVTVSIKDANGDVITGDNSDVTLALYGGSSGGTLEGTLTVAAVDGVATFDNLLMTFTGTYTLKASDGSYLTGISTRFMVSPAAADQLRFVQQPSGACVGRAIAPAVTVELLDAFGNVASSSDSTVSLALSSGPTGGTLTGTMSTETADGIATFSNLQLNQIGSYVLSASGVTLSSSLSEAFSITGLPTRLVFGTQPTSAVVGGNVAPVVKVYLEDENGTVVTSDDSTVTLMLASGPSGGVLGGILSDQAVNGVATFSTIFLDVGGTYSVRATDGALASSNSNAFVVGGDYTITTPLDFHRFDGYWPECTPVIDSAGDVYIIAPDSNSQFAIWEDPGGSGTFSVIAQLTPSTNGWISYGLTLDSAGNLYGTTEQEAANGTGAVFELPNGSHTLVTLAAFPASIVYPGSQVVVDAAGDVYGTCYSGGSSGSGVIWEITKGSGIVTTVASFTATSGEGPQSNLVMDGAGNLFGTTSLGGSSGFGTIYELARGSNTISATASFDGNTQSGTAGYPIGTIVIDSAGNLYGSAGNTVFEVESGSNAITNLIRLPAEQTIGELAIDASGNLFGVGMAYDPNTVPYIYNVDAYASIFEITKGSDAATTIAAVDGTDGYCPYGITLDAAGDIWGTTYDGGSLYANGNTQQGYGVVFELTAPHLVFQQQPDDQSSTAAISNVTVTLEDSFGHVLVGDDSSVTLSLTSAATGAVEETLNGSLINGVASFSDVPIPSDGTYTLVANDALNSGVTSSSNPFTVIDGDNDGDGTGTGNTAGGEGDSGMGAGTGSGTGAGDGTAAGTGTGTGSGIETGMGTGSGTNAGGGTNPGDGSGVGVGTGSASGGSTSIGTAIASPVTLASNAHATSPIVSGKSAKLLALGADSGGESKLTYTWSVIKAPAGAKAPIFSINGTNAAKQVVATFAKDGGYRLRCTISDGKGHVVTTDVSVTVVQTPTTIRVTPHDQKVHEKHTLTFQTTILDQFGHALRDPAVHYSIVSGQGTISATSGIFTASTKIGSVLIDAADGSLEGLVELKVVA